MNTKQNLKYAQHRLALSKTMNDKTEIENWKQHVEYWKNENADAELQPGDFIALSPTAYELERMKQE